MVTRITPRQVVARMASGEIVSFVDARTAAAFEAARCVLPGATHVGVTSIVQDAARVRSGDVVVVYGEGDGDLDVPRVAEALRGLGPREVRILAGGFAAWSDLRYAVQLKAGAAGARAA